MCFQDFILEKYHLDVVLYEVGNATLNQKIEIFGVEKMAREVENLKKERLKMEERCREKEETLGDDTVDEKCVLLRREGSSFTRYLKNLQTEHIK